MSKKMKIILSCTSVVLLVVIGIVLFLGLTRGIPNSTDPKDELLKDGIIAQDFDVELLDGTKTSFYKLKSNDKVVLLNFWATWCPPCIAELPDMNELALKLKAQGDNAKLEFIAICISDSKKEWQSFMTKTGYSFNTALDEIGISGAKYNVIGIPTTYLISSDNKILKSVVGAMTKSQLEDFVADYL